MRVALGLLVLAAACLAVSGQDGCTAEHWKVGKTAALETKQHQVSGTVVVLDDCTFGVQNFTYDGTGPDVFWYGADSVANLDTGFIMDGIPSSLGAWDGSRPVNVTLPEGVTWDDINAISVWCRAFGIDFGSAVFTTED
eukprot:evm.model.scf_487.2 EVM.evm.TU.scf_487.2   scf_487:39903-41751(-)